MMTDPAPARLRIGSLCSGYGGLDMAVQTVLAGTLTWVADPDPGATATLAHHHPHVPNLGDVTAVDWVGVAAVDVVTAGFPCQDISYAGRGAGIREGNRSGLWHTIAHAVGVLRPELVVLENVAAIVARRPGLDVVLSDLAGLGFDAEWTCVRASDIGGAHQRDRWFLAAHSADLRHERDRLTRHGRPGPTDRRFPTADAEGQRHRHSRSTRERGVPPTAVPSAVVGWGAYGPAVRRWEQITGRPAPAPTEPGRTGDRLSPVFVEWLMGLPAGHVTAVPDLTRNQMLRLLGNGVVPHQGAHALRTLLPAQTMQQRAAA
jgi:DNA (cytosine-5)-methyltransferase 1